MGWLGFHKQGAVMRSNITRCALVLVFFTLSLGCAVTRVGVKGAHTGAVVSQSQIASDVGAQILRLGGNAVDAAVATAMAMAVTHPAAGNVGGGGFMVVMLPTGEVTTFDFRERAPLAVTADIFLDEDGQYDKIRHHWSHLAVGVPGTVAGLVMAHQRLGRLPWDALVAPAVTLARDG